MRSYKEIPILENIPVFVRAALNVPLEDGVVRNEHRLRRALPTLKHLREEGARIIVGSHIGNKGTETLKPVVESLDALLGKVSFCEEALGPKTRKAVHDLSPGDILVLENLRRYPGEIANDASFARELASLADVFVQDSFDTCHRTHASIVQVPELLPSYAGWELIEEVEHLSRARTPEKPALAIIGGAKFATKEPVIMRLLEYYDHVFVGGALANDFFEAKGYEVGRSLVSHASGTGIKNLLTHPRIMAPVDGKFVKPDGSVRIGNVDGMEPDEAMLDHGPETVRQLTALAKEAKTVLWNGPLGEYEKGFVEATDEFAKALIQTGAHSIVGGGDTVAEIERIGLLNHFSFVSIGGGAMLAYLAQGTLPGIEVLG